MEDDLKECRNKKCPRNAILVQVTQNRKYCSACGARLKNASWRGGDGPPLIDPGPDSPRNTVGGGNGAAIKIMPYFEFKGSWMDYSRYLSELGVTEDAYSVNSKILEARNRGKVVVTSPHHRSNSTVGFRKDDDTFTVGDCGDIKGCPIVVKGSVEMPHSMFYNWVYLALKFKTEWIAYLKGSFDEERAIWLVTAMYFPKQKANGAHVDAADGEIQEGTIGSVHSHVGMSAFFSTEDEKHFNHPVEIVVNNKGDWKISLRQQLECGRFTRTEGGLFLTGNEVELALATDLEAKLREDKPEPIVAPATPTTTVVEGDVNANVHRLRALS